MSCHAQAGPAIFCSFIEDVYQEKITQSDWHAVRELAAAEAGVKALPRRRMRPEDIDETATSLADMAAQENGLTIEDADSWSGAQFDSRVDEMRSALSGVKNTEGTLAVINYLARQGVLDTLARVRDDGKATEGSGSPEQVVNSGTNDTVCVCGNTVDGSGFYAYGGNGREVEPDENWDGQSMFCGACARVFNQDTGEVTGQPDRIVNLDGFEVAADRGNEEPESTPPSGADRGPYGNARVGENYTGYRDAALIAKDVRKDIKAARARGDLPDDVEISVRTSKYSGGQAVDVSLKGWTADQVWDEYLDAYGIRNVRLTPEAERVRDLVEGMRESYNRDASDSQMDYFDNTYYGNTQWDVRD